MKSSRKPARSEAPTTPSRGPLLPSPAESQTLLPADHLRLLIELLRPAGPELARRWLACLLLVPSHEREELVAEVEKLVASRSHELRTGAPDPAAQPADKSQTLHAVSAVRQRDGYAETVETTYEVVAAASSAKPARPANRRSGA